MIKFDIEYFGSSSNLNKKIKQKVKFWTRPETEFKEFEPCR